MTVSCGKTAALVMGGGMLVVFGAINLDIVFPVHALPRASETIWSESGRMEPGGKGATQAIAAARDGARVTLVGAVGHDSLAEMALEGIARAGVGLREVHRVDAATGRAAICVTPDGYTAVAADRGANRLARAAQVRETLLGPATTLLLQMDTEPGENATLIARARRAGSRIVLNLSPAGVIDTDALRSADVLIASSPELAWLGEHIGTGNNPASIHAALGVATVRMMGVQGAEAMSDDGYVRTAALPVKMRDSSAAGDCFVGVLAAAMSRGAALPEAMRRASVAAGLSVTRVGTGQSMPTAAEIDAALRNAPEPSREQPSMPD